MCRKEKKEEERREILLRVGGERDQIWEWKGRERRDQSGRIMINDNDESNQSGVIQRGWTGERLRESTQESQEQVTDRREIIPAGTKRPCSLPRLESAGKQSFIWDPQIRDLSQRSIPSKISPYLNLHLTNRVSLIAPQNYHT